MWPGYGRLDLVNSPCLGIGASNPFYRDSIGSTVSVSGDGTRFAFVSALDWRDYSRIWVADIEAHPTEPTSPFSAIDLSPNYILTDGSNQATFAATLAGDIQKACFDGYKKCLFFQA